jgi:multidrug efflux pump subunit AcrB
LAAAAPRTWIVVAWFQSFRVPLLIIAPIGLTLVGILPVHAFMDAFTARSIIGFVVGASIIVRNSSMRLETSFSGWREASGSSPLTVQSAFDHLCKHRRLLKPLTASAHANLRAVVKCKLHLVH